MRRTSTAGSDFLMSTRSTTQRMLTRCVLASKWLDVPKALPVFLFTAALVCGCGRPAGPPSANAVAIAPAQPVEVADIVLPASDWPCWRGARQDGCQTSSPPATWTDADIAWKAVLPGRGHSSPIVIGDGIYLQTADEDKQIQSVLKLDRATGKIVWATELFHGGFETAVHHENSQASSTLAGDGTLLYSAFLNSRKVWLTALDRQGKTVWQTELGDFDSKFGFSASPTIHEDRVLLNVDHQRGGYAIAVGRADGAIVWKTDRPARASYASGRVIELSGKSLFVVPGCNEFAAYDPTTGKELWSTPGLAEACVGTVVSDGNLLFASGGYPERITQALRPDGTVAWENRNKVYVPSMIVVDGHLYAIDDDGVARCYEAATGKMKWQSRMGGNFRASPVAAGGHIYTLDMGGQVRVLKADPEAYQLVFETSLGKEGFASPAVSGDAIFSRVRGDDNGRPADLLYAIGTVTTTDAQPAATN